jgi:hypothetical protein
MTCDDDRLTAALESLRAYDLSPRQAQRLRVRCHARLRVRPRSNLSFGIVEGPPLRRVVGPLLGGAWCLAYLIAMLRFAAAVYGF